MKQFKVGDWVTINWHQEEEPHQITDIWEGDSTESVESSSNPSSTVFFDTCAYRLLEECTHWQPKKGEWCWFWDKGDMPMLLQSSAEIGKTDKYTLYFSLQKQQHGNDASEYCEPLIGQLPSCIKD